MPLCTIVTDKEGCATDDEDEGPSPPEVLSRPERPIAHNKISSMRKKIMVVVVDGSFLRGKEDPICWKDTPLKKSAAPWGHG